MKQVYMFTWPRMAFFVLVLFCVSVGSGTRQSTAVRKDREVEKQEFLDSVRDGVGTEVRFARQGDDSASVRASVESLARFMRERAGVDLSNHSKDRLAELESQTLDGTGRRITSDELGRIIATTAVERISELSDDQIDRATETLRGFDDPELPDSFRRGRTMVQLRASVSGNLTPEEFRGQVKAIRDTNRVMRGLILAGGSRAAADLVERRRRFLGDALPDQFGSATAGFTPVQALLVTYSAVSDDYLTHSGANLRKRLKSIHDGMERITGQRYPSHEGRRAYGPNGYIFSTPLDTVFDDQTINRLFDHIQERSRNQ
ncbi:MAG: hypothetical protein QOG23_1675 [Blastocatellia bacterium]|nr:hypothetical protein [Blastocatellia bacterium]